MQAEEKYNQIASWFNTPEPSPEPKPPGLSPRIWSIVSLLITIILLITGIIFFLIDARFDLVIYSLIIVASFYIIKRSEWNVAKEEWEEAKNRWEEAVAKYDALPSVSQMEQWLEEDLENLKKGALQQTGLDEESEIVGEQPVIMRARVRPSETREQGFENHQSERRPRQSKASEWSPRSTKATEHKHYLFPIWYLTILYICRRSIAIYRCEYNWSNNRLFNESTAEYFYSDMGGIERQSVGFDEIIRIRLNGGKSEEIVLNEVGCPEPSNRADMAARAIRRLIKNNKPEEAKPDD